MRVVVLGVLPLTLAAQGQEHHTDFRGRDYSIQELEKALFPEGASAPADTRGVPKMVVPPPKKVSVTLNVFFEFNSDTIRPKYHHDLDKLGEVLSKAEYAGARMQLEGHTDSVGSERYILGLSRRRADSVKQYLVKHFPIESQRLMVKGFGEKQPRETNATDEGRSKNRRVEVVKETP